MTVMKIKKILIIITAIFAGTAGLTACDSAADPGTDTVVTGNTVEKTAASTFTYKKDPVTVNSFKLDTYVSISAYADIDESYLEETLKLCDYYEDMFSMHKEDGALYDLNANVTDRVPKELGEVIATALEYSDLSEGSFQISIGRVSELWDFTSGSHEIPADKDIKEALKTVDDSKIKVFQAGENEYIVEKPAETKIDLGAVAKGYIADRLKEDLISRGITSAVINLGGNVLCVGDKNGEPFNVGIRKPFAGDNDMLLVLAVKNSSVVSSGISERYFEKDSHIYHHILNPKTGYPYENELWQTTVISEDSLSGDILSTLCYALGSEKAMELCEDMPDTELILVKDDLSVITSKGAEKLIK